jgi:hypothetical protein
MVAKVNVSVDHPGNHHLVGAVQLFFTGVSLCDIGCFANKHDAFAVDGEAGVPDYAALGVNGDGSAAEQDQVDDLFVT